MCRQHRTCCRTVPVRSNSEYPGGLHGRAESRISLHETPNPKNSNTTSFASPPIPPHSLPPLFFRSGEGMRLTRAFFGVVASCRDPNADEPSVCEHLGCQASVVSARLLERAAANITTTQRPHFGTPEAGLFMHCALQVGGFKHYLHRVTLSPARVPHPACTLYSDVTESGQHETMRKDSDTHACFALSRY